MGDAVFAALAFLDMSTKVLREQLMAVTDAQYRHAGLQQSRIDIRAAGQQYAAGAAGNNDSLTFSQHTGWRVAGLHIGINAKLPHATRYKVRILAASI